MCCIWTLFFDTDLSGKLGFQMYNYCPSNKLKTYTDRKLMSRCFMQMKGMTYSTETLDLQSG